MGASRGKLGVYPASLKSSILSATGREVTFDSTTLLYSREKYDSLCLYTMIYCLSKPGAYQSRKLRHML